VYGYPIKDACKIAIETTCRFLNEEKGSVTKVIFILFSSKDYNIYDKYLKEISGAQGNKIK